MTLIQWFLLACAVLSLAGSFFLFNLTARALKRIQDIEAAIYARLDDEFGAAPPQETKPATAKE